MIIPTKKDSGIAFTKKTEKEEEENENENENESPKKIRYFFLPLPPSPFFIVFSKEAKKKQEQNVLS